MGSSYYPVHVILELFLCSSFLCLYVSGIVSLVLKGIHQSADGKKKTL